MIIIMINIYKYNIYIILIFIYISIIMINRVRLYDYENEKKDQHRPKIFDDLSSRYILAALYIQLFYIRDRSSSRYAL